MTKKIGNGYCGQCEYCDKSEWKCTLTNLYVVNGIDMVRSCTSMKRKDRKKESRKSNDGDCS